MDGKAGTARFELTVGVYLFYGKILITYNLLRFNMPTYLCEGCKKCKNFDKKFNHGEGDCECPERDCDVPAECICDILERCNKYSKNRYLFLTKNPGRYGFFQHIMFSSNMTLGCTIESDIDYKDSKALSMGDRVREMGLIPHGFNTFISIEPIMKFTGELVNMMLCANPNFIAIGANSNRGIELSEPDRDEVNGLIRRLELNNFKVS